MHLFFRKNRNIATYIYFYVVSEIKYIERRRNNHYYPARTMFSGENIMQIKIIKMYCIYGGIEDILKTNCTIFIYSHIVATSQPALYFIRLTGHI